MHILCIPAHTPHAPHPRTYYAPLRMYGVTEMASSRRMGAWALYPHIPCISPHILRSAVYVRGYRDSVFQTHGGMGSLSSHPLHPPAHTTLRCVCTGLQRWRLTDALPLAILIYNHFSYFPFLYFSLYVEMLLEYSFRLFSFMTSCHFCSVTIIS